MKKGGIFGITKKAGTALKVAGGSRGYDPFTSSISKGKRTSNSKVQKVSKKVYA